MAGQPLSVSVSGGSDQAQDSETPSSSTSFGSNHPMLFHPVDVDNPLPPKPGVKLGGILLRRRLKDRSKYHSNLRRVKRVRRNPSPFHRLLEKSELGKLFFATLATMMIILASYSNLKLITEDCMHNLLIVQAFTVVLLTCARFVQRPIFAAAATLLGIALVIASFYTIILMALPKEKRWPVHFVVFPCLACLVLYVAYEALKEMVSPKKDKDVEDESGATVTV